MASVIDVVSTAVWLTSCLRASYGEGYSANCAEVPSERPSFRRCLLDGRGVEDLDGDRVMFDISRSCIESVEMCCAEGVEYVSEVSRVPCD